MLFDHFVLSMHWRSFLRLPASAAFNARTVVDGASGLLLAAPVPVFCHIRGTHGSSVMGTLWRMFLLLIASSAGFAIILAAFPVVGPETLRA